MMANLDLKQIERKAWMTYWGDGVWDIYLGLLLLGFVLVDALQRGALANRDSETSLAYNGLVVLIFFALKRWLVAPRIGRVKWGPQRQSRRLKLILLLAGTVSLGLILAILTSRIGLEFAPLAGALVMGIFMAATFWAMAYLLDFRRLYLYGSLFGLSVPADRIMRLYTDWPYSRWLAFGLPSLLMLVIGAVSLAHFVRDNPSLKINAEGEA